MVFFVVYVVSFFFSLWYEDWFLVWVGLEMNMMGFLSMMSFRGVGVESLYKYFFIQSLASGMFLVMVYMGGVVSLVLSLKLGAGPFYFWLPGVMSGLEWVGNFFVAIPQSLLPLVLMKGIGGSEMWMIGGMSLIVGVVGSFNQVDLRALMAFSSVSHVGWMIVAQMVGGLIWCLYFIVYVLVVSPVFLYFWEMNLKNLVKGSMGDLIVLLMLMLNLAGMPPMVGFVMKWMVLLEVIVMDFLMGVLMIISSLVMFYVYLRVVYDILSDGGVEMSWMKVSSVLGICGFIIILMMSVVVPMVMWFMI